MQLIKTLVGAAAALAFAATAQATVIVNLDALTPAATDITLDAGTYNINIVTGGYSGYTFKYEPGVSEAFWTTAFGTAYVIDSVGINDQISFYPTTADALSAFATGPYKFYDGSKRGYGDYNKALFTADTLTFTLAKSTTVSFGIPDDYFPDNGGGVSLAITSAVPEPETYALMLAGLAAVSFIALRRRVS